MAGNPKKRAMIAELERRTREQYPDEPEKTKLDYVCDWLADGRTFRALCRDLGVSNPMVYDALNHEYGMDVVRAAFSRAREAGAHALAEEAVEIADDADKDTAIAAGLQVRTRQWVAERWNQRELGAAKGGTVQVNIGQLMLTALQRPAPARAVIAPVIAEDAEVVTLELPTSSESE